MNLEDVTVDNPHPDNPVVVEKGFETPQHRVKQLQEQNKEEKEDVRIESDVDQDSSEKEENKQANLPTSNKCEDSSSEDENLIWGGGNN